MTLTNSFFMISQVHPYIKDNFRTIRNANNSTVVVHKAHFIIHYFPLPTKELPCAQRRFVLQLPKHCSAMPLASKADGQFIWATDELYAAFFRVCNALGLMLSSYYNKPTVTHGYHGSKSNMFSSKCFRIPGLNGMIMVSSSAADNGTVRFN